MGTTILLIDDHPIIRAGLKTFIEQVVDDVVTDEAWDAESAFEKIHQNDFELIISDADTLGSDPFKMVSMMLMLKPQAKILMFTMKAEDIYARKYLQLGVTGYLSKDSSESEIKSAVKNILGGKKYISASVVESLTEDMPVNGSRNPFYNLSPRESEILQHLIRGESVAEISKKIHLHTSTIGTFKARIFKKLHCKNIIELNDMARAHHFVKPLK